MSVRKTAFVASMVGLVVSGMILIIIWNFGMGNSFAPRVMAIFGNANRKLVLQYARNFDYCYLNGDQLLRLRNNRTTLESGHSVSWST